MMMTMRTLMGSSRIKLCRVKSVVAAKEKCYSISTLLSPSGSIVPLKGTRELLDKRLPLTKIVATIGPASEHLPALSHVVDAGMRIMRINFSHATYDEADLRMRNLSACAVIDHTADAGQVHMRAVMLDTQGPEIRTGSFSSGTKEVLLKEGDLVSRCNIIHLLYAASTRCPPFILVDMTLQCMTVQRYCTIRCMQVTLTTDESVRQQQTSSHIWISYRKLYDTVSLGSSILLDDGIVELKVESKGSNGTEVTCRVMNSGVVGNKKGVNMPGLPVELPAMSDKDKLDIRWGIQNNIDYIAASFVRKASDVTEIRDYCRELIRELYPEGGRQLSPPVPIPSIISKIESVEALINFESILQTSDAIMVARGDLAVEIPMETLANVQKEMVRRCNAAGKPVIVATQMLESMQKNPRPTRAECTDVANAVIDGADCVMLSGESAEGETKRKRDWL